MEKFVGVEFSKTDFFAQFGKFIVKINEDDTETGDYQLFHPEERYIAQDFINNGYTVASVYDREDEDIVIIENDTSESFMKVGYIILSI
jgi:glutathione synthase/RimK-type ligase-like ATP-grasp enzyme